MGTFTENMQLFYTFNFFFGDYPQSYTMLFLSVYIPGYQVSRISTADRSFRSLVHDWQSQSSLLPASSGYKAVHPTTSTVDALNITALHSSVQPSHGLLPQDSCLLSLAYYIFHLYQ
ncbi:hypothetical protein CHARACLAT_017506 [Characodon lateralis]|uniref:Uncharacterized protein n=1 Tax=Characodon lateralis TaxID=208331 RepID=A0ABU7CYJ6_9TELE|nr:hypothetical protein [Characodon lateralis]